MALGSQGCMWLGVCSIALVLSAPLFCVLSLHSANGSQIKFCVEELFVPAIVSDYSFINSTFVFFVLSIQDDTYEMDAVYDNITVKFYFVGTNITPIVKYTWPGFYQYGSHKRDSTIERSDYVQTQGISLAKVSRNVSKIVLRMDLVTAFRFKYSWWQSKTHAVSVQGDVKVSTMTGKNTWPNGVKLSRQDSGGHYEAFLVFSYCFSTLLAFIWFVSFVHTCSQAITS